jgi:hypothetical protein
MNAVVEQSTRRGQKGLLVVAFSTPFMLLAGTGGYVQASYQETTGSTCFVSCEQPLNVADVELNKFIRSVKSLKDDFGLGVDQLSLITGVSRPTTYSWLKEEPKRIHNKHQEHVASISKALEENISESNRKFMGRFLRRKLDNDVVEIINQLSQETQSLDDLLPLLHSIDFKLEGIRRSEMLESHLSSKNALI